MESVKKTFRIPELTLKKWTAALRSGDYLQGKECLYDPVSDSYCCLGVLQMVCDGEVCDGDFEKENELPHKDWAEAHGIAELNHPTAFDRVFNPDLGERGTASLHNDDGSTFPEIANLLEKYAETY